MACSNNSRCSSADKRAGPEDKVVLVGCDSVGACWVVADSRRRECGGFGMLDLAFVVVVIAGLAREKVVKVDTVGKLEDPHKTATAANPRCATTGRHLLRLQLLVVVEAFIIIL